MVLWIPNAALSQVRTKGSSEWICSELVIYTDFARRYFKKDTDN